MKGAIAVWSLVSQSGHLRGSSVYVVFNPSRSKARMAAELLVEPRTPRSAGRISGPDIA
jgi:hypothetical protein